MNTSAVVASNAVVMVTISYMFLASCCSSSFRRIVNVETESTEINVTMSPEQESTEYRLGEDVENTIEDSLRVRWNHVSTFRHAPSNGVKEP